MNSTTFTGKEFVESFTFSTANREDLRYKVKEAGEVDGRLYFKGGKEQSVTMVGNKYRCADGKYILMVGISLQNPMDIIEDKKVAESWANARAIVDPYLVMTVNKHFAGKQFIATCELILSTLNLQFVKTGEERKKTIDARKAELARVHAKIKLARYNAGLDN